MIFEQSWRSESGAAKTENLLLRCRIETQSPCAHQRQIPRESLSHHAVCTTAE